MKGKLVKVDNGYVLMVNNTMYATDNYKLSLKNCEVIEKGYDLDELVEEAINEIIDKEIEQVDYLDTGFVMGFQKALEIIGKNKLSKEEVIENFKGLRDCIEDKDIAEFYIDLAVTMFSEMKPNEWDVSFNPNEKDSEGCLILKRI